VAYKESIRGIFSPRPKKKKSIQAFYVAAGNAPLPLVGCQSVLSMVLKKASLSKVPSFPRFPLSSPKPQNPTTPNAHQHGLPQDKAEPEEICASLAIDGTQASSASDLRNDGIHLGTFIETTPSHQETSSPPRRRRRRHHHQCGRHDPTRPNQPTT